MRSRGGMSFYNVLKVENGEESSRSCPMMMIEQER